MLKDLLLKIFRTKSYLICLELGIYGYFRKEVTADTSIVGQKVRNCRLTKGYTQKDLAKKIGVTYQVILQYEKGTRKISIEKLYAIAEVLSIGIVDLIPASKEKSYLEDEGEEILDLVRKYKKINDHELRRMFCLLTKFVQVSEKSSKKAEKFNHYGLKSKD